MNWDKFIETFQLQFLLIPNLRKEFRAAAWYKIPVLIFICAFGLPHIVLLNLVGWLRGRRGRRGHLEAADGLQSGPERLARTAFVD